MPLLDHFRPPVLDFLPWETVHTAWMVHLAARLNDRLPPGYYALEHADVGPSVEIDVATFERDDPPPAFEPYGGNGAAVATLPAVYVAPAPAATLPAVFADDFEVLVWSDRSGRHLAAAVELVSPRNKDRPESRRAFASKCASYLAGGVAVVVADVVTTRTADLHAEVLGLLGRPDVAPVPGGSALWAAAYRPVKRVEPLVEVWVEPAAVGAALPTLPLWLNAVEAVPVEFEAAYADACRRRRLPV